MNSVTYLEYRASSSLSKHEGESSLALCDRLDRTRANSQRQLPTDHDYAVPTREYQTDQSSLITARLLLAQSSENGNCKNNPTDRAQLTWSLHIRATHSLSHYSERHFPEDNHHSLSQKPIWVRDGKAEVESTEDAGS